jgi:branched-chain amino acid transport system substrate-binding protein
VRVATTVSLTLFSLTLVVPAHADALNNRAVSLRPIYIGQIAPATGAFFGLPGTKGLVRGVPGAQLALRQINAQGGINGRPLKLVVADDRSTNAGGIAALHKLVASGNITAILGPGQSAEVLAMTPSIEQAGIPMIIGGSAPGTTHAGDRWVFRTRPNAIYSARAQTTFAVSTLHLSRIALFYNDNTTGKEIHRLQRGDLKALGITPVAEQSYPVLARDLTAQVLTVKKSGATALITEGQEPADYRLLARQMLQVGVHLAWVGDAIMALAATLPGYGTLLHGTYAVSDYVATQSPEAAAFDRAMEATFHIRGAFPDAFTYDGMQILARVIRKVGTNPQSIRRGILAIRGYRGAMGTYNFDPNGDGLHQYTVVQNVQGRLRVVKVLSS